MEFHTYLGLFDLLLQAVWMDTVLAGCNCRNGVSIGRRRGRTKSIDFEMVCRLLDSTAPEDARGEEEGGIGPVGRRVGTSR